MFLFHTWNRELRSLSLKRTKLQTLYTQKQDGDIKTSSETWRPHLIIKSLVLTLICNSKKLQMYEATTDDLTGVHKSIISLLWAQMNISPRSFVTQQNKVTKGAISRTKRTLVFI